MFNRFYSLGKALREIVLRALALCLPPICVSCKNSLPATEPVGICADCYAKIPWWNRNLVLPPCLPKVIDDFKAPCFYEEPLRGMLLAFKFGDATELAPYLAKLLLPYLPVEKNSVILVPVPSHVSRLRSRLYNHSALLAVALGKISGQAVVVNALQKVRKGIPQAEKTRAGRLKLSGRDFEADEVCVKGKHVVLIDDILTTGATAHACSLALKRAGALKVSVVTVAYTRPK